MAAAADDNGRILRQLRMPTPLDLEKGLAVLNQIIETAANGEQIMAIGAAIGGPLDWKRGIVSPLHQPQWREVQLKTIMEREWRCPFYVDVDTNVAALGEYNMGKDSSSRLLYLTLSTGMGGGYLVDGNIYRGMKGAHPEIGHQSINYKCSNPDGIVCECGVPDCLEAFVSGNGIRRIYHKAAEDLNDAEWGEVAYNLGQGLRNLATTYLPDVIVLGGGVAIGGGRKLLREAKKVMEQNVRLVPVPRVRLSRLGYDTALVGAVVVAMRGLE